jgi:mevalonate kinase
MGAGSGKGKSILFGEHFVVYGHPALAAGIASETTASVTKKDAPGWTLNDNRPEMPGYKEKKADEQRASIENILRFCGINVAESGIHIELGGELVCASGIGASAASCVAIARALNEEFNLGMDDSKINAAAYQGEMGYHGTPSGIDNTASTFGGLVWFTRDLEGGPPDFEILKLKKPVHLVIASTGITASTKDVVGDVKKKKENNPEWWETVADEYLQLVTDARTALINLDLHGVGTLMNRNHELLQELTVSCRELDTLVGLARDNGALGAKMTGTGRGGNMIALAPDKDTMARIAKALESGAAEAVWTTAFGL